MVTVFTNLSEIFKFRVSNHKNLITFTKNTTFQKMSFFPKKKHNGTGSGSQHIEINGTLSK